MTIASTNRTRAAATGGRAGRRDWRAITFRGVAALIALLIVTAIGPYMLAPWALITPAPADYTPELHRWHSADISALIGLLIGGSLLALIPQPRRRPLLGQFALLAIGLLALACLHPFHPGILVPATVIFALLLTAYPVPRDLLSVRGAGAASRPLLALALASAAPLLLNAWTNLQLQYTDASEHAHENHWIGSVALALALILGGLLSGTKRPGSRTLAAIIGLTYCYLGTAALTIPEHDGSWGTIGGLVALTAGGSFLLATILAERPAAPPRS